VHIRQAIIDDAATIQTLAETIWWPTYSPILSPEQLQYMLDHIYDLATIIQQITTGEQTYLLLSDEEEYIGFASYAPRSEDPSVFKLHKLYCLPQTKGRGLGKMLLNDVEKRTMEQGVDVLELNVNKYNPAKGFYDKMRYKVIREEDIPVGPYWMNDYVMRKVLRSR